MIRFTKWQIDAARKFQPTVRANLAFQGFNLIGVDSFRLPPGKPEQNCSVGRMSNPGQGE